MRINISEYEIHNLYGLYNHKIVFNPSENVSILHGPNGVGKTALLKSLNFLFNKNFSALGKIPFSKIHVKLSDDTEINIKRVGVTQEELWSQSVDIAHRIDIDIVKNKKNIISHSISDEMTKSGVNLPPWFVRVGLDTWMDERTGEEVSRDMLAMYTRHNLKAKDKKNAQYLEEIFSKVKVHFVETNRLYRQAVNPSWQKSKSPEMVVSVHDCAKHLVAQVGTALKDYGKKSQELDQSFPHRFISERAIPMGLDELKSRLNDLATQLKNLRDIGLLDVEVIQPFNTESLDTVEQKKVEIMNLYVRDSETKLAVFDELSKRVQLFLKSLNKKFRNKSVSLSREKGLVVRGPGERPLPLDALSSGEQHEMVLLYELLFKVPVDTLVLIDEPELSLHVIWQKAFLPELISIAEEAQFYSIVATHSPFIVGERFDLMTALDSDQEQ
ncbi:AAA family ATPase [Pseudomonas syringae group sp. 247E2]|uniref:AAA family ATPase n=1 Tax=Pseudomonas syringae group sp. 247E2 TaxID=3079592 RepID=UPI0029085EF3|nr:AAA family ATPase [Pseudomonas syringae group sp. 247E2]MDU8604686.1 AAA family ATPase [Pseudomonas syringae group sp. 247E2]